MAPNSDAGSPKSGTAVSPKSGEAGSPKSGAAGSPKSGAAGSPKSGAAGSPKSGAAGSPKSGAAGSPPSQRSPSPLVVGVNPQNWTELPPEDDDADSALGDAASSTASITSSIMHYRTVNGRTYHADRGDNIYWGPNDNQQNGMMDIMHHAYTLSLGDKLYHAPLPEHIDKALDIGTGTGIWAIDFADERTETQVVGTDLSPIQPTWVPPNCEFQIDDFTEPWTFPPNSVDYIHIRWLVGSVVDWPALFKKAYDTLKPGGWLESHELDSDIQCDDGTLTANMAIAQYNHIFVEGGKALGSPATFNPVGDGVQRHAMDANGFVRVHETPIKMPMSEWPQDPAQREVGLYTRAVLFHDTEGIFNYMASQIGWTPENVTVFAAHLRRELRSLNVHCYYRSLVVTGQKPLDEGAAAE